MRTGRQFTIGQLARSVEIPASTVRYYERIGLLEPEDRSQGNYRLYGQQSIRRLRFIRAAQSIGFTLDDVQALQGSASDSTPSCQDVQGLLEERLHDIGKQLQNLQHVQRVLKASLRKCRLSKKSGCCQVLESLQETTALSG